MGEAFRASGYGILDFDIIKGKGCYLYDTKGKKYLDFEAGVWCCALGHGNSHINKVIREQIENISHTGYRFINHIANEASYQILDILDMKGGKCSFLSSGTEAVELAVQIGRQISKAPFSLVLDDQYFGSYGSAKEKKENEYYKFDYKKCNCCEKNDVCDFNCPQLKMIPFDKIGSFIFEPGGKGGFAKFPPLGLVRNITEIVKENNGLIVINEVTTGLGRTGKWFGFQHYDIDPDIVAMGKIIGNGYPVSATAFNRKVFMELLRINFHYAQSHTNDPLGCVIASKVIEILKNDKLINRSRETGEFFTESLKEIAENHDEIKEIRGRGLLICIEFKAYYTEKQLDNLFFTLLENGYLTGLIRSCNSIRFLPPFIVSREEIINLIKCLDRIL